MTSWQRKWQIERLRRRLYSRMPLIGGWWRRRAVRALAADGSTAAVRALAEAVARGDAADERVREEALDALRQLDDWRGVSAACGVWAETRHADLTALLVERGWVASTPVEVKVLTALKVGQLDAVREGDARVIKPLVQACEDADPRIAQRARQVLRELESEETREVLCRYVVEKDHPIALEAAIEAEYVPQDEQQRALYFFITEQWERYEGLDYDQQLLRTAYAVADDHLRQRIREKLRAAGRTEFLTVIAGKDPHARATEMTPGELDLLTQTLTANREWRQLWGLVFEAPFCRSVRIVETLARAGWEPEGGEGRSVFKTLVSLATQDTRLPTGDAEVRQLFPPALLRAQARVPGRINDVAFSPIRPAIAIGTGVRKVVVWDYQQAKREHLLGEFDHSVGDVAFIGDGTLLWAERTNATDVSCAIYRWRDDGADEPPALLGRHLGSVTAIAPVGDSRMLSAGRDHKVILWDVHAKRELARLESYDWARAMQVSPDGQRVALLHKGLTLAVLPTLDETLIGSGSSVGRCAAFLPAGYGEEEAWTGAGPAPVNETLLVGQYNGDVVMYRPKNQYWIYYERPPFTRHKGRAEGVNVLHSRAVVVTAGSEGIVRFIDLKDRSTIGEVQVPLGRVTSLHISPDESFMAVGNSEASLSLWDIRGLDALELLLNPFGRASASALATLSVLAEDEGLSRRARLTLKFAEQVLRHRIRFDIEIGEAPRIMLGEFDIEVE